MRMMRSGIMVVVALMACGKPNANRAASADTATVVADTTSYGPKACELLSADEIARLTHITVKPGVTTNDYAGDSQCKFERTDTVKGGILVSLHAQGRIEPYAKVPGTFGIVGLGDTAVWNSGNGQLAVKDGAAVFSISFLDAGARQQWGVTLARSALKKRHATK